MAENEQEQALQAMLQRAASESSESKEQEQQETGVKDDSDLESEPVTESSSAPASESASDSESEPVTESGSVSDSESESASESSTATESESDSDSEIIYATDKHEEGDFLQTAEAVSEDKLGDLMRLRHDMSNDLSEENLVTGVAETLETFTYSGRKNVPMLKVRLKSSGLPVYVPRNLAGVNFNHMEVLIGHTLSVAIMSFVNINEGEADPNYIIIASIQQAEFVVKGRLYSELTSTRGDEAKNAIAEKREGIVTGMIRLNNMSNSDGSPQSEVFHWLVFFEYKGVQFSMPAYNYNYFSFAKPISSQIRVGEHFYFHFTRATKKDFLKDNSAAKREVKSGDSRNVPQGIYYDIDATALSYRTDPAEDLKRKLKQGTVFLGQVVGFNNVRGLLVEVAPGWVIKGYMDSYRFADAGLGDLDVAHHTPVTVRLRRLDLKRRRGQCEVVAFPQGTKGNTF